MIDGQFQVGEQVKVELDDEQQVSEVLRRYTNNGKEANYVVKVNDRSHIFSSSNLRSWNE